MSQYEGGRPHANMADVAREAGVSVATVSRALRDLPGVGEPTRSRIKEIADRLRYVVSPEASALASGATGRVAVVASGLDLWFYSSMLAGIESELRAGDHDVMVYQVQGTEGRERFFTDQPTRRNADALIIIALPVTDEQAAGLSRFGMHVVIAGGRVKDFPHVRIDDVEVGRQATQRLIDLGHERIAMIRTNDPEGAVWDTDLDRVAGYRAAMEAAGLPIGEGSIETVPFGIEGGALAMERILARPDRPTAVFAHSDEVAFGALRTLRRAGISVPEEMSLFGVDDQPIAVLNDLSTVHQSVVDQGRAAGRMVLDLLAGREPESLHVVHPTYVVERGTTAPLATS